MADVLTEQRELLSRLRAVVEAKDAENQVLRAELDAARERERRLELRLAELAGCGWTAPIRARRPRRSRPGRENAAARSVRYLSGSAGRTAAGAGSPATRAGGSPGTRTLASARTRIRRRSAAAAAPGWTARRGPRRGGRSSWTCRSREWLRNGRCWAFSARAAGPPRSRPAIRRARRVGVVRPGAERRRGRADLVRERAARTGRARYGHAAGCAGVGGVGGQGRRPAVPAPGAGRVRCGDVRGAGGRAGAGRGRDPGERAGPRRGRAGRRTRRGGSRRRGQGGSRRAARAGHPDPGRAADLAAGPGVTEEGGRHRRGAAAVHRVPDHRRVQGIPAVAAPARRRRSSAVSTSSADAAPSRNSAPAASSPGPPT